MKILFTFILGITLSLSTLVCSAQSLEAQAEIQTKEMTQKLNLNEGNYLKLKNINLNRLHRIAALAKLREQDHRYLDLRLDAIEEEYSAAVYKILKPSQFSAFMNYRQEQPYTYAGVTNDMNRTKTIAIQTEE